MEKAMVTIVSVMRTTVCMSFWKSSDILNIEQSATFVVIEFVYNTIIYNIL